MLLKSMCRTLKRCTMSCALASKTDLSRRLGWTLCLPALIPSFKLQSCRKIPRLTRLRWERCTCVIWLALRRLKRQRLLVRLWKKPRWSTSRFQLLVMSSMPWLNLKREVSSPIATLSWLGCCRNHLEATHQPPWSLRLHTVSIMTEKRCQHSVLVSEQKPSRTRLSRILREVPKSF